VKFDVEPDRARAIRLALQAAQAGDIVLLAGKGHERQQILATGVVPFDDAEAAAEALAEMGFGREAAK
jgi:UDP-N-acetylmuramoyl-L-alanyl-D-glutamate--2,6-diaminopimelate ligase